MQVLACLFVDRKGFALGLEASDLLQSNKRFENMNVLDSSSEPIISNAPSAGGCNFGSKHVLVLVLELLDHQQSLVGVVHESCLRASRTQATSRNEQKTSLQEQANHYIANPGSLIFKDNALNSLIS